MKRIIAVIGTEPEEPWLVDAAAQLAKQTGAAVTALAVDDVESQRFEALPRSELLALAERAAERAAKRLHEQGVEATALARSGPAVDTVIDVARKEDADLIVVGASRRGPMVEKVLGSLPLDLIQRGGRQVLVVQGPDTGERPS
jgi:nucleotide-binding universal stress UspA family protein